VIQTLAILQDAYRELNAKKLFWITLLLSGLVVVAIGIVGINDRGLTVLGMTLEAIPLKTSMISEAAFYKLTFMNVGVKLWLSWAAAILALISTAGIFPDFLAGGSIELTLSKPISRIRLFLTKYVSGLLFVALQVGVFTIASFLVIGIRGGAWEWRIFLAIPIVVAFFSYLFCLCVLIGLVTRSAVASLLLTILFWLAIFGLNTTDGILLSVKHAMQRSVDAQMARVEGYDASIEALAAEVPEEAQASVTTDEEEGDGTGLLGALASAIRTPPPAPGSAEEHALKMAELKTERNRLYDSAKKSEESLRSIQWWHARVINAKTILPKTQETVALLNESLMRVEEMEQLREMMTAQGGDSSQFEAEEELRNRPVWWVLGTSLGFEAVILGIGAWIFCRRDF